MTRRAAAPALAAIAAALLAAGCGAAGSTPPSAPAAPPAAVAPDPGGPFGIVADTADGRARRGVRAGGALALRFRVVNPTPRARTLRLRPADAPGGAVAAPGAAPRAVGAWLRPPASVRVGPRASRALTVRLAVPPGTAPGLYRGALAAAPVPAAQRPGVAIDVEAAAAVVIRVRGGGR